MPSQFQHTVFTLVFACLFFMALPCTSQDFDEQDYTTSKKAWKFYQKAREAFNERDYSKIFDYSSRAVSEDSTFILPVLLIGDAYADRGNLKQSIAYYEKAVNINPEHSALTYYVLAKTEFELKLYLEAADHFEKYLTFDSINPARAEESMYLRDLSSFRVHALLNPVPFEPKNLGNQVNTENDEYVNSISTDDKRLILTRKTPVNIRRGYYREEIYLSEFRDSAWSRAVEFDKKLNVYGNVGAITLSPDGIYVFFTLCYSNRGYGSCDIFYMKKKGDGWSDPGNLGPIINTGAWESQPSFSSDGRTLYFASRRPGGKGSSDIWKSVLLSSGRWSDPQNLEMINTDKAEMAPFIHPDGRTLYFASQGFLGMGGFDLFYTRLDSSGKWQEPVNLGYPINTEADEINMVVNAGGDKGYISSDLVGGLGGYDIYRFDILKSIRPNPVTYMKGKVLDNETGEPLDAYFELIDLQSGDTVVKSVSDKSTGEYLVCLPVSRSYALSASREGYLFHSENFNLRGDYSVDRHFIKDIHMKPLKEGESVILKNIFFDTDKYALKEASRAELNKLVDFLKRNPDVRLEISGHTDNVGTYEYNQTLSMKRAESVYNYLTGHGIDPGQLTYMGYGYDNPVATNDTEEGRAMNRRTEMKVVGVGK